MEYRLLKTNLRFHIQESAPTDQLFNTYYFTQVCNWIYYTYNSNNNYIAISRYTLCKKRHVYKFLYSILTVWDTYVTVRNLLNTTLFIYPVNKY